TIIAQTQKAVNATKGTIILLDEAAHVTHRVVVREGEKPDLARSVPDEVMSHGLAGWILRNHRGTVIADARQDERWLALPDDREQPGSVVGVPLSRADRLVGVLFLMHPQPGYFTDEHLALLETLGAQISASIENAFLFKEINEE